MKNKKTISIILVVVLLIIVIRVITSGGTISSKLTEKDVELVQEKVSSLLTVPQDEKPIVAIVDNPEQLKKEQPFYANVEAGDILVIYASTRQAILYRQSNHKIINSGVLQIIPPTLNKAEVKTEVSTTTSTTTKATSTKN